MCFALIAVFQFLKWRKSFSHAEIVLIRESSNHHKMRIGLGHGEGSFSFNHQNDRHVLCANTRTPALKYSFRTRSASHVAHHSTATLLPTFPTALHNPPHFFVVPGISPFFPTRYERVSVAAEARAPEPRCPILSAFVRASPAPHFLEFPRQS